MPVRLGPPPKATSDHVSRSMKANKKTGTTPEIRLVKMLKQEKIKGYRLNWSSIPGSPDICFLDNKLAVFINGCFWHRCPYCKLSLPKTNRTFWANKFTRNKARDKAKLKRLKSLGWGAMTVWECQIKSDINKVIGRILKRL